LNHEVLAMTPSREAIERLAGEYVLGTLRGPARARFEDLLGTDDFARQQVDAWHARLAPLDRNVKPVTPPAAVWDGIEARLGATRAAPVRRDRVQTWRALAAGFAFLSFVLTALLLMQPAGEARATAVAVMNNQDGKAAWVLKAQADGSLRIECVAPVTLTQVWDYELWVKQPNGAPPRSLGVVPARPGMVMIVPAVGAQAGTEMLVTKEPRGGSPTGVASGNVLYSAALKAV
jgi:anti-sigma-K factor RskA